MIPRRSSRTDPRLVLGSALALALPFGANFAAFAQNVPSQMPASVPQLPLSQIPSGQIPSDQVPAGQVPSPSSAMPAAPAQADAETLKQRDQELDAVRAKERASAE